MKLKAKQPARCKTHTTSWLFLLFLFAFSYQFQNLCLTNRYKIQHIRSYHLQHSDLAFSQSMPNYCYAHDRKLRYCHENSPPTLKLDNETGRIVAYFLWKYDSPSPIQKVQCRILADLNISHDYRKSDTFYLSNAAIIIGFLRTSFILNNSYIFLWVLQSL